MQIDCIIEKTNMVLTLVSFRMDMISDTHNERYNKIPAKY